MRIRQPLFRTPLPIDGESFRGYLLRLCERNYLTTPNTLLKFTSMASEDPRISNAAAGILGEITGHTDAVFERMIPPQLDGHWIAPHYISRSKPKICPECVQQLGYIPALWDLFGITVCHIHAKTMITQCETCNKGLTWSRPGLLTCRCESKLSSSQEGSPSQALLDLTTAIATVMQSGTLQDRDSKAGLPFTKLTAMELNSLVGVCHSIGAIQLQLDDASYLGKSATNAAEIAAAAGVLKDWPYNYHVFLKRFGERFGLKTFGLRRQFAKMMPRIFNLRFNQDDVQFLKAEFIDFSRHSWDADYIDTRLMKSAGVGNTSEFMSVYEYADYIGITPATVRSMIKKGYLLTKTIESEKLQRKMIDLNKSTEFIPYKGPSYTLKNAIAYLGIPASVLTYIRRNGHFSVRHIATPFAAYALPDLDHFRDGILASQIPVIPEDIETMTIADLFRMKLAKDDIKARMLIKIMKSELPEYGSATQIRDMRINKPVALAMAVELSGRTEHYTAKEASLILQASQNIVHQLVKDGYLAGYVDKILFVGKTSVEEFRQQYIGLQQLAKQLKISIQGLNFLIKKSGINRLKICDQHGNYKIYFRREDRINLDITNTMLNISS